jgi:Uma2 family endonuclease
MNPAVETAPKVWTEAELQALPNDAYNYEVVDGELVMSPKNDFFHGDICVRLSRALSTFAEAKQLGIVLDSSTGFWMKNRNCRAPDISFVSRQRLKAMGFKRSTRSFFRGAPDLAVEVLSLHYSRREMDRRLEDFFESGTRLAWIIDPENERVEVCRSPTDRALIGSGGLLDGQDVLPGFQFPIADLFQEWDWD